MTETPAQAATAAPAPATDEQVTIEMGPDLGIYPDDIRPPETPASPPAPEAPPAEPPSAPSTDAGAAPESPQQGDDSAQGSRRQRGQEAYERGLAEGRAAIQREQAEAAARQQAAQQTQEASQRVNDLFTSLGSRDPLQQAQARQGLINLYQSNQQMATVGAQVRQQILQQMATDFGRLRGSDGIDDDAYQQLHTAPDAQTLVQRAMALGRKQRDADVERLEGELTQLRGRLVGRTATPEPANGNSGGGAAVSWDQYISMSPQEARKLTPRQIDAITAAHARELDAMQNGHL